MAENQIDVRRLELFRGAAGNRFTVNHANVSTSPHAAIRCSMNRP